VAPFALKTNVNNLMKHTNLFKFFSLALFSTAPLTLPVQADDAATLGEHLPWEVRTEKHDINFNDVPMVEFIRYVTKISHVNFIYNPQDLQFHMSLNTGKAVSSSQVLQALMEILRSHNLAVFAQDNYFVIRKGDEAKGGGGFLPPLERMVPTVQAGLRSISDATAQFFVYKLKYHQGSEIQEAVKRIGAELKMRPDAPTRLLAAIESSQWVKTTNSLLFSADEETVFELRKLVDSLDIPLRQVFIEVLVIETDVRKSLDFGLQWAASGEKLGKVGFGGGNFTPSDAPSPFAQAFKGGSHGGQFPMGGGFDLGVIGDIIMHKGRSFLTLGSLVSALQVDGDSSIVLNQKIITQDNKNSKIFVGDNIPFTGSVVQTVGAGQQTTSNIEYRDIGVSLSITPMLGDDNIITLDIDEEISETMGNLTAKEINTANGIRTTKTNMVTHVHVPDKHFLVLSGMIRNAKSNQRAGVPCLGGMPVIGALFSNTKKIDEKRNVVIFVRPHIIHTVEDYKNVTQTQKVLYEAQSQPADFASGLGLVNQ
jgi:type III secretion protein C